MSINGDNDKSRFTTRNKYEEFYRLTFLHSEKGIWLAQMDKPIPIDLPIEEQLEHLFKHAYLAECNLAFAKMYGYDDPNLLTGVRFPRLFDNADASNLTNLQTFLKDNYQIRNAETVEIDKNGNRKLFLNDTIGIVEDGNLVRVWGMQQDITVERAQRDVLKQMTPNQIRVLKATVEGKTMKEIAADVEVSPKTVESLRNQLKAIVGANTLTQLITIAIQLGIQNIDI
jgi:DNA-binding CsgD family transcriptional regulator